MHIYPYIIYIIYVLIFCNIVQYFTGYIKKILFYLIVKLIQNKDNNATIGIKLLVRIKNSAKDNVNISTHKNLDFKVND